MNGLGPTLPAPAALAAAAAAGALAAVGALAAPRVLANLVAGPAGLAGLAVLRGLPVLRVLPVLAVLAVLAVQSMMSGRTFFLQIRVYSAILGKARQMGFVIPDNKGIGLPDGAKYEGATVLDAKRGAYFDVVCGLDFACARAGGVDGSTVRPRLAHTHRPRALPLQPW